MQRFPGHAWISLFLGFLLSSPIGAQENRETLKLKRRPTEFAIVFLMGYAADNLPQDDKDFERLVQTCRGANYNVMLGKYSPQRESICKRHDIKMMVDLLVPDFHIYKNAEGAKALCKSIRNSNSIYGYHLWSDGIGGRLEGRNRDIANVHQWDPNHAVYVGDRSAREIGGLMDADLIGYYDFHWKRLGHFRHLFRAHAAAKKTEASFLRYIDGAPGQIGKGNYNRVLYTVSTSIAFGMKGYLYHYTADVLETKSWKWKALGEDLKRVNAEIAPLGPELMKIGLPDEIYSTPITKTAKDRPVDSGMSNVPVEFKPIPDDFPIQVLTGEAIMSVFQEENRGTTLFFANHNAYKSQTMQLKLDRAARTVFRFDRLKKMWLKLNLSDNQFSFDLKPANGELVRVKW